jgi:hypothetical protein
MRFPLKQLLYSRGTMRIPCVLFLCLASLSLSAQKIPTNRYPVVIVELENHSYSSMYLSSSMPNLTSYTKQYGVAQNFDANGHYSIGNYMFQTFGKFETTDDSYNPDKSGYFSDDNIVRHIIALGNTYKMYEESIDAAGSTELVSKNGLYVRRHNPLSFTSEFGNMTTAQRALVEVGFGQFTTDLKNHTLPDYSFVTPNLNNDAHDGTLQAADAWLQTNIFTPLLADSTFRQTGMLIITVDESLDTDCLPMAKCPKLPEYTSYCTSNCTGGGGHVLTVLIGPGIKPAYASSTLFMHESTLKSMLKAIGDTTFPGGLSGVSDFGTFYQSLVNPGFELAAINWSCHAGTQCAIGNTAGVARTGSHYADLTAPGAGNQPTFFAADGNGSDVYYPVTSGQVITLSAWGSRISGDGSARPVLELTDSSKKNPSYVVTTPSNVSSKTWTSMTTTYTVPAGKAFVRLYMEIKGPTQKSEARFDDFSLQIQ